MNIYNNIKETGTELTLEYFGRDDIATDYDVKCILLNKDFIKEYYLFRKVFRKN